MNSIREETTPITSKAVSRRVSATQMLTTIKILNKAKNFSSYVKKKFGTLMSRGSQDTNRESIELKEDSQKLIETGRQSNRRTIQRGRFHLPSITTKDLSVEDDFEPVDSKGLVSLFWKRDDLIKIQETRRILKNPPVYREIGPPTYLESIGHPNANLKGAEMVLNNKKRIDKVVKENNFYAFIGVSPENAHEMHKKNMDVLIDLLGEFLTSIRGTTWFFNNNNATYFNRKEYNFLKAIGDFAIKDEVKEKRLLNIKRTKELIEKIRVIGISGREYLQFKDTLVPLLNFFITLVESLNEFEVEEEEDDNTVIPSRRGRILQAYNN